MIGEPRIETRDEQPCVGIHTSIPMHELPTVIPRLIGEVFGWLAQPGIAPAGPPFCRYYTIDMASKVDIEIGVLVASPVAGDGHVTAGTLPAGRYAVLTHTGVPQELRDANAALLDWIKLRGLVIDQWDSPNGDAFGARFESYLTDPAEELDQAKWQTDVAMRLADSTVW